MQFTQYLFVLHIVRTEATELREHCAARLAAFKVPREVVFVESLASGLMHKPGGAPPEPA